MIIAIEAEIHKGFTPKVSGVLEHTSMCCKDTPVICYGNNTPRVDYYSISIV